MFSDIRVELDFSLDEVAHISILLDEVQAVWRDYLGQDFVSPEARRWDALWHAMSDANQARQTALWNARRAFMDGGPK